MERTPAGNEPIQLDVNSLQRLLSMFGAGGCRAFCTGLGGGKIFGGGYYQKKIGKSWKEGESATQWQKF